MAEFRTSQQYNKHLHCLAQSLPAMITDLVQIIQEYCVVKVIRGMHLDCSDTLGMWLEAQVVSVGVDCVYIHYIGYSTDWDEWIHLQSHRLLLVHTFSPEDEAACLSHPDLRVSNLAKENKARRIARFVAKNWRENDVILAYEKLGWYSKPFQIHHHLLSHPIQEC